jgi:hypothetical protein
MRRLTIVVAGVLTLCGAGAELAAQQLTDAQRSAIKSACRSDYQNVCANVPPGTKDSLQCLVQHSDQVSAGCRNALAPAAASAAAAPAAATASAATTTTPAHPLSPREQAHALRSQCGGDFQKFCPAVPLGGGRGVACLREHAAELTPACRGALMSAAPH